MSESMTGVSILTISPLFASEFSVSVMNSMSQGLSEHKHWHRTMWEGMQMRKHKTHQTSPCARFLRSQDPFWVNLLHRSAPKTCNQTISDDFLMLCPASSSTWHPPKNHNFCAILHLDHCKSHQWCSLKKHHSCHCHCKSAKVWIQQHDDIWCNKAVCVSRMGLLLSFLEEISSFQWPLDRCGCRKGSFCCMFAMMKMISILCHKEIAHDWWKHTGCAVECSKIHFKMKCTWG